MSFYLSYTLTIVTDLFFDVAGYLCPWLLAMVAEPQELDRSTCYDDNAHEREKDKSKISWSIPQPESVFLSSIARVREDYDWNLHYWRRQLIEDALLQQQRDERQTSARRVQQQSRSSNNQFVRYCSSTNQTGPKDILPGTLLPIFGSEICNNVIFVPDVETIHDIVAGLANVTINRRDAREYSTPTLGECNEQFQDTLAQASELLYGLFTDRDQQSVSTCASPLDWNSYERWTTSRPCTDTMNWLLDLMSQYEHINQDDANLTDSLLVTSIKDDSVRIITLFIEKNYHGITLATNFAYFHF